MKSIIDLVRLDFITVKGKSMAGFSAAFLFMFVMSLFVMPHQVAIMLVFAELAVQPIFNIAEQSGFNKLYGSLPIKKEHIPIARFLLTLIVLVVTLILSIALGELSAALSLGKDLDFSKEMYKFYEMMIDVNLTIPVCSAILFAAGCVATSIEFSLLYIFGTSKAMVMSFAAVGGLCVVLFAVIKAFDLNMDKLVSWLTPILADHQALFIIACLAVGILIMAVFAVISSAVYKRREL